MKKPRKTQYTIRSVPDDLDRALRRQAKRLGRSLNAVLLDALRRAATRTEEKVIHTDLDQFFGSMQPDPEFDRALEEQRQVDPEMWK